MIVEGEDEKQEETGSGRQVHERRPRKLARIAIGEKEVRCTPNPNGFSLVRFFLSPTIFPSVTFFLSSLSLSLYISLIMNLTACKQRENMNLYR